MTKDPTAERAAKLRELIISEGEIPYALQATLIELSNEIQIHVDHPELAPIFYRIAAEKLIEAEGESSHSLGVARTAMRHLNTLLEKPTVKSAKLIAKYWDGMDTRRRVDPFPEK